MFHRKLLSILIAATDLEQLKKCLDSVLKQVHCEKCEILIAYPSTNTLIKEYLKSLRQTKGIKALPIELCYRYPKYVTNFRMIEMLQKINFLCRKVPAENLSAVKVNLTLYEVAAKNARGKYLLYLPLEMRLRSTFWEKCIEPLRRYNKVGAEILLANQIGENRIYEEILYSGKTYLHSGEGMGEIIYAMHPMSYALLWKHRCYRETKKRICATLTDAHFNMELYLYKRMMETDTIVLADAALDYSVPANYKESFNNLTYPIERLAFLKGMRRFFDTIILKHKIDLTEIRKAIDYAENGFRKFALYTSDIYESQGENYMAKRYKEIAESLMTSNIVDKEKYDSAG